MHCVNRIKCCGWIEDVTFLYDPGSLFPLMWTMMLMRGEIHTPEYNKVHYTSMYFLFD